MTKKTRWNFAGLMVCVLAVSAASAQEIAFSPSLTIPDQTDFTVDLRINAQADEVIGVHVVVNYDAAVVRLDRVEAGSWLEALGVAGSGYFFHDFTPEVELGVLRFDAAALGGVGLGAGQLAVCHFTALGPGTSPLTFVTTEVRGSANEDLGFGHSTGDLIRIDPGQIYFDPSTSTPTTIDFTVDLAINAVGFDVKGAEVVVSFDPALVSLTDITPGDWITDQGLLYYFYDYTTPGTGEIHFAMSFLDGSGTGSGVFAVCHFTALAVGQTPLPFVTVDVRGPSNENLGFGHSEGDRIIVDQAIRTESARLGEVKAMFH